MPLRSIADALGAETDVDAKARPIDVVLGGQSFRVRVGDTHATLNGMPITLKHAPFRVRGRVMISLDAVARALHVRATYDPRNARIEVDHARHRRNCARPAEQRFSRSVR